MLHSTYLPFTAEDLRPHFVGNADRQIAYFQKSVERYLALAQSGMPHPSLPLRFTKAPCQIEKDERFWTAIALKRLVDAPNALTALRSILARAYGATPPLREFATWEDCLVGKLRLILEAVLPAPRKYLEWLRNNISQQHMIPYVLRAASSSGAQALEGPTHVDAVILNEVNGFALCIEAKVLSDISVTVSFDAYRNQLVRNLDVMLENHSNLPAPLSKRKPEASLFGLLSPRSFLERPQSRLYGWLMREYTESPDTIARDLPHRDGIDTGQLAKRMGWITFEDITEFVPNSCPWLVPSTAAAVGQSPFSGEPDA